MTTLELLQAHALVARLGWMLVHSVWQVAAVGLAAATALRALRGASAHARYVVACAGLAAAALLPVLTFGLIAPPTAAVSHAAVAVERPVPEHPPAPFVALSGRRPDARALPVRGAAGDLTDAPFPSGARRATARSRPDPSTRFQPVLPWLVAAWAVGVLVLSLRLGGGWLMVQRLKRRGVRHVADDWADVLNRLAARVGVRRAVRLLESSLAEVPLVIGWLRPVILLPASALTGLTPDQLEAILVHELAHVRRHDYLVNLLQCALETLLFYHPALWWLSRRVREEREHCCDDLTVAVSAGDPMCLARALLALEEQRGSLSLRVAASGGSLQGRIVRLLTPGVTSPKPGSGSLAGAGLLTAALGLLAVSWAAESARARADAPKSERSSVTGRVVDEKAKPVPDARVRLYQRDSRFEHPHSVVTETTTATDGTFRMTTPLEPLPLARSRAQSRYVLVADHPGKAVGWRTLPLEATTFEGDVTLTAPSERTVAVVDEAGRPVAGAKVTAHNVGDQSSPSPDFRDHLELRPDDGPLTAITGADGRARLTQLPKTTSSVVATKLGWAENYAFREQGTIHLTPSASLSGIVAGPGGEPLAGVKVVLHAAFMWDFEYATTDARGMYRFADLKARDWDMSAWTPNKKGDGKHKLWIDSDRWATRTATLTLEPGENQTFDVQAEKAGVIRVTLQEEGIQKPVAGARIWGFDAETRSGGRFNAYTDDQGRATFYSVPAKISLSLVGPPDGVYIKGDLGQNPNVHRTIDFAGGETAITLVMPPIAGSLLTVAGACTLPEGSPAANASIIAGAGAIPRPRETSLHRTRRTDGKGNFALEGIPSNHEIRIYAESADRKFAGTCTFKTPDRGVAAGRASVLLAPTVTAEALVHGPGGKPLGSQKFHITPKVDDNEFMVLKRTVQTDAKGWLKVDGIVPGLTYRVQEDVPPREGPIFVTAGGRLPWYNDVLVLAPKNE